MDVFQICRRNGFMDLINILDINPQIINIGNEYKETPLHIAASFGSVECVNILIEKGANINAKDNAGCSPLHSVLFDQTENTLECIKILIKNGADVNAREQYNCTSLHLAAEGYDPECLDILINNGADINARDIYGRTPLMRASSSFSYPSMFKLLDCGADWTIKDYKGETFFDDMTKEDKIKFEEYIKYLEYGDIKTPDESEY